MNIIDYINTMSDDTSSTRVLSTSDLSNPNAKILMDRLKMYCKWLTCIAISEMKLMPKQEKVALLLTTWSQTVNSLKVNESAVFMRCEVPTSRDWDTICSLLKTSAKSGSTVRNITTRTMYKTKR